MTVHEKLQNLETLPLRAKKISKKTEEADKSLQTNFPFDFLRISIFKRRKLGVPT